MAVKVRLDRDDGELTLLRTEGSIVQDRRLPEPDAVGQLLGDGVYERKVLLDLSESSYIDSSGVSWLLECHRHFRQGGGKLVLHSAGPTVGQVLTTLRVHTVLNLAKDLEDARQVAVSSEA